MSYAFILTVFASFFAWGADAPTRASDNVEDLLRSVKVTGFTERLEAFAEKFLGTPFMVKPLGEGADGRIDQGPLFRFDGFDCTTLVETLISLAHSRTAKEFPSWMRKIRYKNGKIDFLSRNHLPCGDWVPNNSRNGFLTDITEGLAGPLGTRDASALETKKEWVGKLPLDVVRLFGADSTLRNERYAELQKEAARLPPQPVSLKFIPFDRLINKREVPEAELNRRIQEEEVQKKHLEDTTPPATSAEEQAKRHDSIHKAILDAKLNYLIIDAQVDERFLKEIPSGALVNFVRPNYSIPGTRLLISHQGLVFRKRGTPYFIHVSLSGGLKTKAVPLANYLRLCLLLPSVHGIQILRINDLRK